MAKVTEILSSPQEALLEREKELDAREEKLREDLERSDITPLRQRRRPLTSFAIGGID